MSQWEKRFRKIWAFDLMSIGKTFLWQILKLALFTRARARRIGKEMGCASTTNGVWSQSDMSFSTILKLSIAGIALLATMTIMRRD